MSTAAALRGKPRLHDAVLRHRPLTDREVEVVAGAGAGLTNAEIGKWLFITGDTVKTHLRRALGKLGAVDRAQAVVQAIGLGYLEVVADDGSVGLGVGRRKARTMGRLMERSTA